MDELYRKMLKCLLKEQSVEKKEKGETELWERAM